MESLAEKSRRLTEQAEQDHINLKENEAIEWVAAHYNEIINGCMAAAMNRYTYYDLPLKDGRAMEILVARLNQDGYLTERIGLIRNLRIMW